MAAASPRIARYPREFPTANADAPLIDYMRIECVEKNYSESTRPRRDTQNLNYYNDAGFYELVDLGPDVPNIVTMYMPQKITESIAQSWSQTSLQPTVGKAIRGAGNLIESIGTLAEKSLLDLAIKNLPKLGASSTTETSILSSTAGIIYNPMVEVLYDGPQYRTFNYSFTLFAKSEEDAKQIYNIVRFFQYASVPSYSTTNINYGGLQQLLETSLETSGIISAINGTADAVKGAISTLIQKKVNPSSSGSNSGNIVNNVVDGASQIIGGATTLAVIQGIGKNGLLENSRFIKQPPLLRIKYMRGPDTHPYIKSLKPCIIQSLDIDYTPTGSYTILDNFGQSQVATVLATNISINLAEIKTIYREDYSTGVLSSKDYFTDINNRNLKTQAEIEQDLKNREQYNRTNFPASFGPR